MGAEAPCAGWRGPSCHRCHGGGSADVAREDESPAGAWMATTTASETRV